MTSSRFLAARSLLGRLRVVRRSPDCISGAAYDQVRNKLTLDVTDLGLQSLKNISEPVWIYQIMTEPGGTPAHAKPWLALPDKPSIGVLPFSNLSSHPEQEYMVDGIVEDIITELSRFSELFVITHNSSFQYKARRSMCARSDANWASATFWKAAYDEQGTVFGSPPN